MAPNEKVNPVESAEKLRRMAIIDSCPQVRLNGRRAIVSGISNRFATVRTIDNNKAGPCSAEFSWETAKRIMMENDGKFHA